MLVVRASMATVVQERSVRARDQAFERLYERYVGDVYHYSLALLRNPADAEDVTQTTFMNAYRAFKRGDAIHKPHNWLIKIAHNVARSRYAQSNRRVQEVPLEDHVESLAAANDDKPDVAAVLQALGRLPFNQRAALVLRELEGRSYGEIAETLDVSVPAVETLIFRARKTMRVRSSELRVLTGVPVPGSLGQLFGSGGTVAGGGAIAGAGAGASIVGKALVVLLVGTVATGVGGGRPATADSNAQQAIAAAAGGASKTPAKAVKNVTNRRAGKLTILRGGRIVGGSSGAAIAGAAGAHATDGTIAQGPLSVAQLGSGQSSAQGASKGSAPAGAPSGQPGGTSPVQGVTDTVTQVVNTVTSTLPVNTPALPVTVPSVTVPSVTVPNVTVNPPNLPVSPPNLPVSPPNLPVSPPTVTVSPPALPPPPPLPKLP